MIHALIRRPLLLGLLAALPAAPAAAQSSMPVVTGPAFIRDSLAAYVQRGLRLWNIPGLAVAVVKDGQTVVSKGFGTKEVGKTAPVDEHTLFMIASNSKLFTGTALAQLEEEGKLKLDDPVRKYLPGFRLYDSTSTRLVSIRDLLSHRLGTKTFQGDFSFWDSNLSRAEIVEKLRLLKPNGIFRQSYGYCNAGFITAGEIIPAVSGGQTWEDWVQTRLLTPLGMAETTPLTTGFGQRPNIALPYTTTFGPLTKLPFDELNNMGPAASMVSNVSDLTHWLRFQLDSGQYNKQRILPWAALRRTRQGNTIQSTAKSPIFPMHFRAYALGVQTADYNGRQIYWHTGGADGYVTNVCFVPEAGLGITVLTNQDNQSFFEALRCQILDAYLGVPYVDRSKQLYAFAKPGNEEMAKKVAELAARTAKKNKPARSLSAYTGTYQNPVYGPISIESKGKGLLVHFSHHPALTATLDYMDGDVFRLTYSNPAYGIFPAAFGMKDGRAATVEIQVNDFLETDPYLFSRN